MVVGAGLAGLVATAELAEAGRRVVVVDQEPEASLGGQAHWAFGGLFLVDSPEQRRTGISDSFDLALQDWLGSAGFDRGVDDPTGEDHWARQWASRLRRLRLRREARVAARAGRPVLPGGRLGRARRSTSPTGTATRCRGSTSSGAPAPDCSSRSCARCAHGRRRGARRAAVPASRRRPHHDRRARSTVSWERSWRRVTPPAARRARGSAVGDLRPPGPGRDRHVRRHRRPTTTWSGQFWPDGWAPRPTA